MDFYDRIQADENALQKLISQIPGFDGYLAQEKRRTADKLLREFLCAQLDRIIEQLEQVAGTWSRAGQLDDLDDLERVAGKLRRATDKLRFADYGYTGFFDAVKIDQDDLQRFYQYDLSLRQFIAEVGERVQALRQATNHQEALVALDEALQALAEMIEERERVAAELVP